MFDRLSIFCGHRTRYPSRQTQLLCERAGRPQGDANCVINMGLSHSLIGAVILGMVGLVALPVTGQVSMRPERFYDPERLLTYRILQGTLNGYHSVTWSAANNYAVLHPDVELGYAVGDGLIRIVDEYENQFVTDIARSFPACVGGSPDCSPEFWIGLFASACCYDSTCFSWRDGGGPQAYSNWSPSEPNCSDSAGSPFYVTISNSGQWNNTADFAGLSYATHSFWGIVKFYCANQILDEPLGQSTCPAGTVAYTIAAVGSGVFTYQWQVELPPASDIWSSLADGPLPPTLGSEAVAIGATTSTLVVTNVDAGAAGKYRCAVRNVCGDVYSNSARLTVLAKGTGDTNLDSHIDLLDYGVLAKCDFGPGHDLDGSCCALDADSDEDVDMIDFAAFANRFGV